MSLTVIDASVLTAFYATDEQEREPIAARLSRGDAFFAPAHVDADVVAALRSLARRSPALREAVPAALRHLEDFPLRRVHLGPLLLRMWDLRDDVSPYDAAYVALAERLDATLLTADAKLAAATGPRCTFELLA